MLRLLVVGWYLMWSGLGTRVFLDQGVMLREHGRVYTNVDDRFVSLYKKVALPRMSMKNVQKFCYLGEAFPDLECTEVDYSDKNLDNLRCPNDKYKFSRTFSISQ